MKRFVRRTPHALALAWATLGGAGCSSCRANDSAETAIAPLVVRPFGGALPGAPPLDPKTLAAIDAKWSARPPGYAPRTRHLQKDGGPKYTNRLFLQSSPYLLQHAHNPVNWYSWGDEAFEAAKRLHRPVFLSVSYSTCHWCHVMEEESFEDESTAQMLNEHFIAIKVDREERPDVDAVYMQAIQLLSHSGGWPMSVWLTPDRTPFHGGTYYAAAPFRAMLGKISERYESDPASIVETASKLTDEVRTSLEAANRGGEMPPASLLDTAASHYASDFDGTYGGLNRAPKFPSSLPIRFLLRHWRRTGTESSRRMAALTLEKMAAGGIYDQIGGGFHRYSTDAKWLVPHFEKMLYDNALLTMDYVAGAQATGRADFVAVARAILSYVGREMTSPEGLFYSATDADSIGPDGKRDEGRFFTWTAAETIAVLGLDRARIVNAYYGVTSGGNFQGRTVLNTPSSLADVAQSLGTTAANVKATIDESRPLLYAARAKRAAPLRDEKILTAWNGLMISAFSQAALAFGDDGYAKTAVQAAEGVLAKLRVDGRLLRSYKDGEAHYDAYLEDYAFLIAGLLDLFEANGEPRWLREAIALDEVARAHYEDEAAGGFFLTADDHPALIAREKPAYDGAEPSGNSVHALNLARLHELTSPQRGYRTRAERTIKAFERTLAAEPAQLSEMLSALDFVGDAAKEIVIVVPNGRSEAEPFLAQLRQTYLPNRVLAVVAEGAPLAALGEMAPIVIGKIAQHGKATAYVCEKQTCALPTADPHVFAAQIVRSARQAL